MYERVLRDGFEWKVIILRCHSHPRIDFTNLLVIGTKSGKCHIRVVPLA